MNIFFRNPPVLLVLHACHAVLLLVLDRFYGCCVAEHLPEHFPEHFLEARPGAPPGALSGAPPTAPPLEHLPLSSSVTRLCRNRVVTVGVVVETVVETVVNL